MRLLKLLLIVFVCAAVPAVAGPYEDGVVAYAKGDYPTAFRLLRPIAEQGDARAQNDLGIMYETGFGLTQDYLVAATWYRKAADQGNPGGQYNVGALYERGNGVPHDYVQALKWYSLAASRMGTTQQETAGAISRISNALAAKMTPAQIAEAQKLAREWKPK